MASQSDWYKDPDAVLSELRQNRRPADIPDIPGYDELLELKRGGQGIVYSAVQRSTKRRVAIKILLGGRHASDVERRRFEREIDFVAALRHPNIVSLYDSGATPDGRLYLVMEYIEGVPLDEFARGRSIREILNTFLAVCDAVQYAHQRGVIHRDLKPGNIRIDTDGCSRVLDFGLAKTSDEARFGSSGQAITESGQFMGSLPWMSPEQAEGRSDAVDVRTDVYALGVLLFQLTTGQFPYGVTGTLREVLTNIVSTEPRSPRSVTRQIDEDLATITLRCLSKNPEQRYMSAGDLARDIRRYLAGEAIDAKRDSVWYVLRKNLRRHRLATASAGVVLLFTIAYAITVSMLYGRTQAALRSEEQSKRVAQHEARKAASTRSFLEQMLQSVDPAVAQGQDVTVLRTLLDDAARRVESELGGEPEVKASVENTLGQTYAGLGLLDEAERHLTAAFEGRRAILGEEHPDTLRSLFGMAQLRFTQRKLNEAETLFRKVYDGRVRALGPDDAETFSALSGLAVVLANESQFAESEKLQRAALVGLRQAAPPDSRDAISAISNLAGVLHRQGRLDEAEGFYREAVDRSKRALGSRHPETLTAVNNLANLLQSRGLHAEAAPVLREAFELTRSVCGSDHQLTLISENNLGHTLEMQGKFDEAEPILREVLNARIRLLGEEHPDTLLSMNNMATLLAAQQKLDESEAMLRRVLEIRRLAKALPSDIAASLTNLANTLQARGKPEEAETLLREALALYQQSPGEEHPDTLRAMTNLSVLLQSLDRLDEAEPLVRQAYAVKARVLGEQHIDTIISLHNLAFFLRRRGKQAEAEPLFRKCLDLLDKNPPPDPSIPGIFKSNLAQCLIELANYAEAEKLLLEACPILEKALGMEHARTQQAVARLVAVYEALEKPEQVEQWRSKLAKRATSAPTSAPTATPTSNPAR